MTNQVQGRWTIWYVTPEDEIDLAHETVNAYVDGPAFESKQGVPVVPCDEEAVERAALALWASEYERCTGFSAVPDVWAEIENPGHYRALARVALTAAEKVS